MVGKACCIVREENDQLVTLCTKPVEEADEVMHYDFMIATAGLSRTALGRSYPICLECLQVAVDDSLGRTKQ